MEQFTDTYEKLIKENNRWLEEFKKSNIMQLITSVKMDNVHTRTQLLDGVQILSNYFQKIMLLRVVLIEDEKFSTLAQEHLNEEFGHNHLLSEERNHRVPKWDSILDATSAWFTWKMFTLNNIEKTFIVHFVLEGSAQIFFTTANETMQKYNQMKYLTIHAENDEKHEKMGRELLENLRVEEYTSLASIQKQAWKMMITVCDRIAFLAESI